MNEIEKKLKRPFEEKFISWRVGATNGEKTKGIALAYIDARDVMRRLDEVMGMDWQSRNHASGNKTFCEIGLKIDGEWRWRSDGAGDTDVEADKGAISDAFKRAAVPWGVGQYLYSLPNEWVDITPAGRSYKLSNTPTLPKWATPKGWDELMAKRERTKAGDTIHAKSGAWEDMTEEQQRAIQLTVDMLRDKLGEPDIEWQYIHDLVTNHSIEEQVALFTRLNSKEARFIKENT